MTTTSNTVTTAKNSKVAKTPLTVEEQSAVTAILNIHALTLLTGGEIDKIAFGTVAYRFVPTLRESGPKILTSDALAKATRIATNAKSTESLKAINIEMVAAHNANMAAVIAAHRAAILTVLNAPIGSMEEKTSDTVPAGPVTLAYKELGALSNRLFSGLTMPGLSRKVSEYKTMLSGLEYDAYSVIKDHVDFADIQAACKARLAAATTRLAEITVKFNENFPKEKLQLIRMIEMMIDYQNDSNSVSDVEKSSMVIAFTEEEIKANAPVKRIFVKGHLSQAAKDRLNAIQADPNTAEFLIPRIRQIFAKDSDLSKIEAVRNIVGTGL